MCFLDFFSLPNSSIFKVSSRFPRIPQAELVAPHFYFQRRALALHSGPLPLPLPLPLPGASIPWALGPLCLPRSYPRPWPRGAQIYPELQLHLQKRKEPQEQGGAGPVETGWRRSAHRPWLLSGGRRPCGERRRLMGGTVAANGRRKMKIRLRARLNPHHIFSVTT